SPTVTPTSTPTTTPTPSPTMTVGPSPTPSPVVSPLPQGATVTSFQLTSPQSGTNVPFSLGIGLPKGLVKTALTLNIPEAQVIVKKTWNDGSAKHVLVAGHTQFTANQPTTVQLVTTQAYTTQDLT